MRLYYHMDYLGSADYLTSPVSGKVEAWTHYNEWGLIVHNAVLKCGQRELDLVKRYATHDYDSVLELYYAKARFYDAHDRRFTAVDPILDPSQYDLREYVQNPVQFVQYLYVNDSPVIFIDILGLKFSRFIEGQLAHLGIQAYLKSRYVNSEVEVPIVGVFDTKTGYGRIDFLKREIHGGDLDYTEIYEIKPVSSRYNEIYDFLAQAQVNYYVLAINQFPNEVLNKRYAPAKLGKSILPQINTKTLPFPGDFKRFITIITDENVPGMIYYKIGRAKKGQQYDYAYSAADEKTFVPYLKYIEKYECEGAYVTSVNDTYFINEWSKHVKVEQIKEGSIGYTSVTFPNGRTLYRYDGRYGFLNGTPPDRRKLTTEDLLELFVSGSTSHKDEVWDTDKKEACLAPIRAQSIEELQALLNLYKIYRDPLNSFIIPSLEKLISSKLATG